LKITSEKTPDIEMFVDDRAVAVKRDEGVSIKRKLASVMRMYKVAADKFHRPENFDLVKEINLSDEGVELHAGNGDWESGWTVAAIY
jgi:hypothetical protein